MPETIGHYRITSKLGEGGMGVVYAALDERLDRPVAIKMMRETDSDSRARERLWREARAAASINHPNVCQLFEVGEEYGELFIAMELLEGESLAARIARGPLSITEAVQIALSVLGALDALHRRGLVHRDLKPSNVFLSSHGVKLLDFGLARPIPGGVQQTESGLTLAGTIVGTPAYMTPEQLLGSPIDARKRALEINPVLSSPTTCRCTWRRISGGRRTRWFACSSGSGTAGPTRSCLQVSHTYAGIAGSSTRRSRRTSRPGGWTS